MSTTQHSTHESTTESMPGMDSATPAGLEVSSGGYTLTDVTAPGRAGEPGTLTFRILDDTNTPVVDFDLLHEKKLHLIVVRNDTSEFRHVHPSLAADGTWSIDWAWPAAGTYRVFADFDPTDGTQLTLGRNFDVAGEFTPAPLPAKSATSTVDGYTVTLDGDLTTAGGPNHAERCSRRSPGHRSRSVPRCLRSPRCPAHRRPRLPARAPRRRARRRRHSSWSGHFLPRTGTERRHIPTVPRLPARGRGSDRRIHC